MAANALMALILMTVVILVVWGLFALVVTAGAYIVCAVPFIALYCLCYAFVNHMRNGQPFSIDK